MDGYRVLMRPTHINSVQGEMCAQERMSPISRSLDGRRWRIGLRACGRATVKPTALAWTGCMSASSSICSVWCRCGAWVLRHPKASGRSSAARLFESERDVIRKMVDQLTEGRHEPPAPIAWEAQPTAVAIHARRL